jgi:hypothetical protein
MPQNHVLSAFLLAKCDKKRTWKGCPLSAGYDLENCVVGAEKAAWFTFIAIGWQRYPLAQASAAMKGLTHEVLGNHR